MGEGAASKLQEPSSKHHIPDHLPSFLLCSFAGEVSQSVAGKLLQLCQALDAGDFVTATHLQASGCDSLL